MCVGVIGIAWLVEGDIKGGRGMNEPKCHYGIMQCTHAKHTENGDICLYEGECGFKGKSGDANG